MAIKIGQLPAGSAARELKLDRPVVQAIVDEIIALELAIPDLATALREHEQRARDTRQLVEKSRSEADALIESLMPLHAPMHPNSVRTGIADLVKQAKKS